jgi:hypothetical protein
MAVGFTALSASIAAAKGIFFSRRLVAVGFTALSASIAAAKDIFFSRRLVAVGFTALSASIAAAEKFNSRLEPVIRFAGRKGGKIPQRPSKPAQIVILTIVGNWAIWLFAVGLLRETTDLILLPKFLIPYIDSAVQTHGEVAFANRVVMVDVLV